MSTTIPPGYKQTEVGVIPEDWEVKAIQDIAQVKGGKRLPLGKNLSDKPTSHPYIRVTDMTEGGVELAEIKYVPDDVFPVIKNYRIFSQDIFISVAGTLGLVGKIPPELDGANLTENADRITSIRCDRDFLLYTLMSERIQGVINSVQTVGAQPKLAIFQIENFQICLPKTPPEQRAIATALSEVDGLIRAQEQLIAKKRDLKQAAMQQLLTAQHRLPGFSGEWVTTKLGEVASFLKGKGLPKSDITPSGAAPCIHYGELFTKYPEVIGEIISRTDATKDTLLSVANDVLMPTSDVTPRGLAKASCVRVNDVILGGDILVIRSDPKRIDGAFLSYLIRYEEDQILQLVTGSTVFHLYGSDMKGFTFSRPPLPEQTAIAEVLSEQDEELAALEVRLAKTRALKQGMMQSLLTGRIRLV